MNQMFLELTGILVAAGIIAYVLHFFKQPSIIAYIITGLLVGPFSLYRLQHGDILHGLSEIGITLLLFMVGLDLDISQLKKIGKTAIIAGLAQITFTFLIGFAIVSLLGFNLIPAIYISLALTFSSTIIVIKLLSEKKDLQSLYGKLAVGIFLIQDVAAILVLILIAGSNNHGVFLDTGFLTGNIIVTLAKAFMIGLVIIFLSRKVFPKLLHTLVKSDEMLLLFSLGWALGLAALLSSPLIGFNSAIGGFLAGLALANTGAHYQVSGRIKPLRDFFIIIFFIVLGTQLIFNNIGAALFPALVLTIFVLTIKPLIVALILKLLKYRLRTSFMTGITLAQVSEFSLILITLGFSAGHIDELPMTIITLVAIASIAISSYGIIFSRGFYDRFIARFDHLFDKKSSRLVTKELSEVILKKHIIVVGAHRLGSHLIHSLQKRRGISGQPENFLVIDFNPDVVSHYNHIGVPAVCGDIADPYIQEVASINEARMIVCTIPDFHDTLALLEAVRSNTRKRTRLIVAASDEQEALELYDKGADYVLLPHFVGSMHLLQIVEHNSDSKSIHKLRERHLKTLRKALAV